MHQSRERCGKRLGGTAGAGQRGPARDVALGVGLMLTERCRASQRLRTGIPGIEQAALHFGARSEPRRGWADPYHDLTPVGQPCSDHAGKVPRPEQLALRRTT